MAQLVENITIKWGTDSFVLEVHFEESRSGPPLPRWRAWTPSFKELEGVGDTIEEARESFRASFDVQMQMSAELLHRKANLN